MPTQHSTASTRCNRCTNSLFFNHTTLCNRPCLVPRRARVDIHRRILHYIVILLRSPLNESRVYALGCGKCHGKKEGTGMPTDLRQLFSISQAAKACGLSRSTLLRLEQRRLLTPRLRRPRQRAALLRQPQHHPHPAAAAVSEDGLYHKRKSRRTTPVPATPRHCSPPRSKLAALQKHLSELRLRAKAVPNFTFEMQRLPERVLRAQAKGADRFRQVRRHVQILSRVRGPGRYARAGAAVSHQRAHRLPGGADHPDALDFLACVPVVPEKAPPDAVRFPACNAFSMLVYGGYGNVSSVWLQFGHEIRRRGLTPAGYPRVIRSSPVHRAGRSRLTATAPGWCNRCRIDAAPALRKIGVVQGHCAASGAHNRPAGGCKIQRLPSGSAMGARIMGIGEGLTQLFTDDPVNWVKWGPCFSVLILGYVVAVPLYKKVHYAMSFDRKRDVARSRNHVIEATLMKKRPRGEVANYNWVATYRYTIDGVEKQYTAYFKHPHAAAALYLLP